MGVEYDGDFVCGDVVIVVFEDFFLCVVFYFVVDFVY